MLKVMRMAKFNFITCDCCREDKYFSAFPKTRS
nr:MAG TPA: hypothetical protein [Caudoviricetes sp.]